MNPTGRPRQLQPRPGLAVKNNHSSFTVGYPLHTVLPGTAFAINSFAYFHGFDVDGNPADVDPYTSVDGNVKYLKRGWLKGHVQSGTNRQKYEANTFYVIYSDTAWSDETTASTNGPDAYYVAAIPVGNTADNPNKHTWKRHNYAGGSGDPVKPTWIYFTPDEGRHYVIGEGRIANSVEHADESQTTGAMHWKDLKVYQFARSARTIRESYNFNLTPADFAQSSSGAGQSWWANIDFWTSDKLDGTYIKNATIGTAQIGSLSAENIGTGVLRASVTVGGDAKVVIDGFNSRIIISD